MQQGVQTDASCNIQQCWELLPTKLRPFGRGLRLRANGRHIVDQQLPTLFNVTCCVRLHILFHVVGYCCVLLRKVGNRSNFSANNSQPFFLFHDRRRVAQQCGISCWIRLHSYSNINGARHAHYAWFYKDLWVVSYPWRTAGPNIVGSQLHPFADNCQHARNNSQ